MISLLVFVLHTEKLTGIKLTAQEVMNVIVPNNQTSHFRALF